ncbi:MYND-type domain-containing protein [Mycena chlorophos]|uniref:MYND-type domain-containing protein n=1 Tax=Mycena chlorophos TaxID=658473 RepID=A0A8H6VRT5_MYCCL|nr:MYND-type domain-containing protein [Mycena chlorophos]
MTTYYSQPAAANYHTPPTASHASMRQRGYRICDQCGTVETPAVSKFRLCGGCMTTQYCSPACQKVHWPSHKAICQHTVEQVTGVSYAGDNIAKSLRKFTSAHATLFGWAGFQALQLKRLPSNIRQNALLIELSPTNNTESHRRFAVAATHVVPRTYICDPLVVADIQRREERCRAAGGIGTAVIIIQCGSVSQVMPVEVDPPSKITWDARDDWAHVLCHFVDAGRTDFQPISTTARGIYYG